MRRWRRAAAGWVALAALALGACGGASHSQRPAVARYITQVDRIEAGLTAPPLSTRRRRSRAR